MINCETIVIIFLVVIFLWMVMKPKRGEGFDADTVEFVPVGSDRYGLRGEPLIRRPTSDYFIRPDRQVRLNNSGGDMYVSNYAPHEEGIEGCQKTQCPMSWGGFDSSDECWNCGNSFQWKDKIPDIHPH